MKYVYRALNRRGKKREGKVRAKNKIEAKKKILRKGYAGVSLSVDVGGYFESFFGTSIGRVGDLRKLLFTKHLSVLNKAGLTLDEALFILREQVPSSALKKIIDELLRSVEGGWPLSEAMSRFPKMFDPLYVNIIRSGEQGGTLDQSLENLVSQMSRSYELKRKVRSALLYPILILILTVGVGFLLVLFVLPKVVKLFIGFQVELPLPTRVLMGIGYYTGTYTWQFVLVFVLLIVLGFWAWRFKRFKPFLHTQILRIPILGPLIQDFNLGLFSRTLGTLIQTGVPITEAIHITSETFHNRIFARTLFLAEKDVKKGANLSFALRRFPELYPPVVFRMLAVGEETGRIEEVLFYLADFYESEVDHKTKNLSILLEPFLLVVIGLVVISVALAIVMPIYQITASFRR